MNKRYNHRFPHVAAAPIGQRASSAENVGLKPEKSEVLINPRYHFHRPLAVMDSEVLDRQEKIEVLREWAADLREESQQASRTFQVDRLASREDLEEIRSALRRLSDGRHEAA